MNANTVIAIGAALCVPVIMLLTLEVERRADGWAAPLRSQGEDVVDLSVMIAGVMGGLVSYFVATRVLFRESDDDCGVMCSCCGRAFRAVKQ